MSKRGVFWVMDDDILGKVLIAEVFREDATVGISKSGNNYNHRLLWDYIDESFLELIIARFELDEIPKIHYDGSKHYKCYLE